MSVVRSFEFTPRVRARRPVHLVSSLIVLLSSSLFSAALAQTPTPTPERFNLQLTTNRGCIETGQSPVFAVGEMVTVRFRISHPTVSSAATTLFDIAADHLTFTAFSFGQLSTDVTYAFRARVAPPIGTEKLILKASAPGARMTRRNCSFYVVNGPTPGVTTSATTTATVPTRTPTNSHTPTNTRTITPTPDGSLTGSIRTNRGCREDGDNPVFGIGEPIGLSFRVNSTSVAQAQVSIADTLPNGSVNVFSFGSLATNTGFLFRSTVAPPTGVESVQLRAKAGGMSTVGLDDCSFLVASFVPATRTKTPTRTRTQTPTAVVVAVTPTPTATATATPIP